ncbi:hypothetical protein amrb99_59290 [Actinomadura sp. RB99]|uniref:hypothetical protein n=1 Tax=Actinomadura sp. RB99 TaxID=2691577 RepID=UPI00168645F3|nr:hypothetical protein [Actinomadura sp. RB99]MBD2896976.1 hypothetical protein [Actinomadura sp. RB99]
MLGVLVALAFFVLVAYIVRTLRATTRPAPVIIATTVLIGALPPILYAIYGP